MSSAEAPKVSGGFNPFRRLDLLYFVLAGFDLITICAALFLNHTVTTAFEEGVRTSAAWSSRQVEIIHLARLAQETDAPGNDIFYSRDVVSERARHADAYARFETEWERMAAAIANDPLFAGSDDELMVHLRAARDTMSDVARESERIFAAYERGNVSNAGALMAVMDRSYAEVNQSLDAALNVVERIRAQHLEQQVAYARDMRALELLVASAVLVIVCLVAAYGMFIGRTMRAGEEQRLAMLDELAAARDRLQRYADDVSHELRGPISKMRLDAEVLLRQDRTPEQYREGVEGALIEAERLSSVIDSLLFLARADNTGVLPNAHPLDLRKELALIVDFFAASAEQAKVAFSLQAAEGTLMADRSLFQRAVSNLITNALKHTPAGGRVELRASLNRENAIIEVIDNGAGIAAGELHLVFDRFYRGAGEQDSAGFGLGLAIVKSIMDLHRGSVEIAPQQTGGVRATLTFPRALHATGENYKIVKFAP